MRNINQKKIPQERDFLSGRGSRNQEVVRPGAGAKRNTRRGTKASAGISVVQRMGVQPFRERVISVLVDKLRRRKNGS